MAAAPALVAPILRPLEDPRARLIERANRLYHEWTAERFDADHHARHRVEAPFWRWVGRTLLSASDTHGAPGRIILDVACGSGFVIEQLLPWMKPADRALGIDLSAATLARAARKLAHTGRPDIQWVAASGMQLPVCAASVDLVTINAGLHHFAAPGALLRRLDCILRPGGCLAIGYEPNTRYFQSHALCRLGRGLDRLAWYLSPRQNRRRVARLLGQSHVRAIASDEIHDDDRQIAARIAAHLVRERLCSHALPPDAVLNLIDPHARSGGETPAGLCLGELLSDSLPNYRVIRAFTADFLGPAVRRYSTLRGLTDTLMRCVNPRAGSLQCCVLRKEAGPA